MDATLLLVIAIVAVPVIVLWALVVVARGRGPQPPPKESHQPVETLVTDAIPYDESRDEPAHAREQAHHANRPHFD